jgi:NAD+ kinase
MVNKYKSIACIADNTQKARDAYSILKSKYNVFNIKDNPEEAEVLVVLGGDGFMLHNLHTYMNLNIPVYGMNCGTIGFLMNEFSEKKFIERLNNAKLTNVHPLTMLATTRDQLTHKALAINEVYLFRQTNQAAKITIIIDDAVRIKEMIGDGVLIATPAGSSAYNFSAGGPIIPLDSNMLSLTPISPFRPRRWRGALLPHTVKVRFEINSPIKRAVNAVADFHQIKDVIAVEIKEDRNKKIRLLFDPDHSLEDRIIREQFAH